jgi:5-methyltetrahydrofolate--homocysteine methyltransferase
MVSPMGADRLHEELSEHADRIAAAGCELLLARGQGSRLGLMAAVTAAARTGLPIWAVVEATEDGTLGQFGALDELLSMLSDGGASVLLVEVADQRSGQEHLSNFSLSTPGSMALGVLLAASPDSVRGFPDVASDPANWVEPAIELTSRGARVVGGGAGTSEAHTAALAVALGMLHPSVPVSS